MGKTEEGVNASYVMLLEPDGETPIGTPSAPIPIVDGWEIQLLALEGANDSDKAITVPATDYYQILWVWVELTTTATVGDRQIVVEYQDAAGDVIGQVRVGQVQAASLTRYYMIAPALADHLAFRDTDYLMTPMPSTLILSQSQRLRVYDNNNGDVDGDDMVVQIQIARRLA